MPYIIGYGNPLRGDDGFGFAAAERLQRTIHDPEIYILAVQQLTPELMEPMSQAERVLFIDARVKGEPGELRFERVRPAAGSISKFTHSSSPGSLLAGVQALYGATPRATLASVAGIEFGMTSKLSAPVGRALEELTALRVPEWIAGWEPVS